MYGERGTALNKKHHSLTLSILLVTILSFIVSIVFFNISMSFTADILDVMVEKYDYLGKKNEKVLEEFDRYTEASGIIPSDHEAMLEWMDRHHNAFLEMAVIRDGSVVFDSLEYQAAGTYTDFITLKETACESIAFADGEADVYLLGYFDVELYYQVELFMTVFSICIFLLIIFLYIRKKVRYIQELEKEIKIMETGILDHPVTVKGNDELASLAEGMNHMRESMIENIAEREKASAESDLLVVNLSHQIRTPLTSLLLYLDILSKNIEDSDKTEEYIEKSKVKAKEIKKLTDRMFEAFMTGGNSRKGEIQKTDAKVVFEETLSVIAGSLKDMGYHVELEAEWDSSELVVHSHTISRIMDHLHAGILLHADESLPVYLYVHPAEGYTEVSFAYTLMKDIVFEPDGRVSVEKLMKEEGGYAEIECTEGIVIGKLAFPSVHKSEQTAGLKEKK